MRRATIHFLWCGFTALALWGCNAKGDDAGAGDSSAEPETHVVEIRQMEFMPDRISVSPGDSITWINRDLVAHNVAEEERRRWESEVLMNGDSFTMEVQEGASYVCTFHPVMDGSISLITE